MSARRHSAEFKKTALERMAGCGNVTALALELGVRRKFLYLWRDQMAEHGAAGLGREPGRPKSAAGSAEARPTARPSEMSVDKARIAELERLLGRKQLEVEFFKQVFEHVKELPASNSTSGATASTESSAKPFRSKAG